MVYPKFGSWNSCRGEFIRQINVLSANEFAPTKTRMFIIVLTFYDQLPNLGLFTRQIIPPNLAFLLKQAVGFLRTPRTRRIGRDEVTLHRPDF